MTTVQHAVSIRDELAEESFLTLAEEARRDDFAALIFCADEAEEERRVGRR